MDTTVSYFTRVLSNSTSDDLDSFVITGDIDAMWLRDSANQLMPYIPYANQDYHLQSLIEGLINRHAKSILIDSFANSFNYDNSTYGGDHQNDKRIPPMTPAVFEGKYEIDSLCAFLKLSFWQYKLVGDRSLIRFSSTSSWIDAVSRLVDTS